MWYAEIVVKCEVKPDEDVNAFTLKAIIKIYIQVCSFSEARNIVQKFWVSKTTQNKSLRKHLKSGTCWKGNAYYSVFSYFTGWSCSGIFFYSNTYTDCLVAFLVAAFPLYIPQFLRIPFTLVGSKKLTEVVNASSECNGNGGIAFYIVSIWLQCFASMSYL